MPFLGQNKCPGSCSDFQGVRWKWCSRLPELKSNPITVFPTGLALLETLYPKWGTLSRVFRLSATAGSLFCFRFRSVGVGGVAYRFRKYP